MTDSKSPKSNANAGSSGTSKSTSVFEALGSYASRIRSKTPAATSIASTTTSTGGGSSGSASSSQTTSITLMSNAGNGKPSEGQRASGSSSSTGPSLSKSTSASASVSPAASTANGSTKNSKSGKKETSTSSGSVEGKDSLSSKDEARSASTAASTPKPKAGEDQAEEEGAWETVQSTRGKRKEKDTSTASGGGGASSSVGAGGASSLNWRDRPRDKGGEGRGRDKKEKEKDKDGEDKQRSDEKDRRHGQAGESSKRDKDKERDGRIRERDGKATATGKDSKDKEPPTLSVPPLEGAASTTAWPSLGKQTTTAASAATATPTQQQSSSTGLQATLPQRSASAMGSTTVTKNAWGTLGSAAHIVKGNTDTGASASALASTSSSGQNTIPTPTPPARSQSMSNPSGQSAKAHVPPASASTFSAPSTSVQSAQLPSTAVGTDIDINTPAPSSPSLGSTNGTTAVDTSVASSEMGASTVLGSGEKDLEGDLAGEAQRMASSEETLAGAKRDANAAPAHSAPEASMIKDSIGDLSAALGGKDKQALDWADDEDEDTARTIPPTVSASASSATQVPQPHTAAPASRAATSPRPAPTPLSTLSTTSAPTLAQTSASAHGGKGGADEDDDWRARPRKQPSTSTLADGDAAKDGAAGSNMGGPGKAGKQGEKDVEGDGAKSHGQAQAKDLKPVKAAPPPVVNAWAARMASTTAKPSTPASTGSATSANAAASGSSAAPTPAQASGAGKETAGQTQGQGSKSKKSQTQSPAPASTDNKKDQQGLTTTSSRPSSATKSAVASATASTASGSDKTASRPTGSVWGAIAAPAAASIAQQASSSGSANASTSGSRSGSTHVAAQSEPTPGEVSKLPGSSKKKGKKAAAVPSVDIGSQSQGNTSDLPQSKADRRSQSDAPMSPTGTPGSISLSSGNKDNVSTPAQESGSVTQGKAYSGAITRGYSSTGTFSNVTAYAATAVDANSFPDLAQASKPKGSIKKDKAGSVAGEDDSAPAKKSKSKWTAIPAAELQAAADEAARKQAQQSQSQSTPSKKKGKSSGGSGGNPGQQGQGPSTGGEDRSARWNGSSTSGQNQDRQNAQNGQSASLNAQNQVGSGSPTKSGFIAGKRSENAPRRPSRASAGGRPLVPDANGASAPHDAEKGKVGDGVPLAREMSRMSTTSNASASASTRASPRKGRSNLPSPIATTGPRGQDDSSRRYNDVGPSSHIMSPGHPLAGLPPVSAMSEPVLSGSIHSQGGQSRPRGSFGQHGHPQQTPHAYQGSSSSQGQGQGSSRSSRTNKAGGKGGDGSRSAGGYQSQRNYNNAGYNPAPGQGIGSGQYQHQGQSQWVTYDQMSGYMVPVYAAGRIQQQQYMQQQQQMQQAQAQGSARSGANGSVNGEPSRRRGEKDGALGEQDKEGEVEEAVPDHEQGQSQGQAQGGPMPAPLPQTQVPNLDTLGYYVLGQVEYYFSMQNLAMDFFLRQQMDSEGWIDISMIASFNRVRSLTPDLDTVRDVMDLSQYLEVRENKVRLANGEAKRWVLPHAKLSPFAPDSPATQARQRTPLLGAGPAVGGTDGYQTDGDIGLDEDGNPLPSGIAREREQTPAEKQEQAEIELAAGAYAGGPMYPSYGYGVGGSASTGDAASGEAANGTNGAKSSAEGGDKTTSTYTFTNSFTSNKELAAGVESALMKDTGMFASMRREERLEAEAKAKAEAQAAAAAGGNVAQSKQPEDVKAASAAAHEGVDSAAEGKEENAVIDTQAQVPNGSEPKEVTPSAT